jgi:phage tail sheath protein FI
LAEFLSPGIFIEEVNTNGTIVQAVGTSTMSTVGWTERGPTDVATLVTGVDDFQRKFGEYTNDSRVPISVQAFFNNGGSRAYIVRVVPTDSVKGDSCITDQITGFALGTGTGATVTLATTLTQVPIRKGSAVVSWRNNPAGTILAEAPTFSPLMSESTTGPFLATLANVPLVSAPLTLHWTEAVQATGTLTNTTPTISDGDTVTVGATVYTFKAPFVNAANNINAVGGDTVALANLVKAINLTGIAGTDYGTGTVANASAGASTITPGVSVKVYALVGGTAGNTVAFSATGTALTATGAGFLAGGVAAAAKTATLTSPTTVGGADAARISAASINLLTGALSVTFVARTIGTNNGPVPLSFNVDYDFAGALQTVTDNSAGIFSTTTIGGTVITGTIDYVLGAISVTWTGGTDLPYIGDPVTVSYKHCQWQLTAMNPGSWSSRMLMTVSGNANFFTFGTQTTPNAGKYSKFDVTVSLQNTITGEFEIKETYEEIVFDDASDALYFPNVVNDNSTFIDVTDTGALAVPATFSGVNRNESMGTGTSSQTLFTGILTYFPMVKTSLVITYTPVVGAVRTLVADVNGNITGAGLDTTKTNKVNYTTGVFTLNFLAAPNCPLTATTIDAAYISSPTTSSVSYSFTGGANGTLTGPTFDRGQFTSPVLAASKLGMYALSRIDEVMQIVIPDWAGDTTIAGDQLDYAESRKDVFIILTTPKGMDAQHAADYRSITFNRKSKYAAMYWPWVKVTDPLNSLKTLTVPALSWVAGVYARTDQTRNVGKAPGGTVDGALQFLTGLESNPDKGERDTVYPLRVNPLINTTQTGLAVWGVRTLSPTNDVLRYVNAVRLFQFVEKSIFNSTFGFVFESITSSLYGQIKTTVDGFLNNLYNTGYFAGNSPSQAYFVICDDTNNPPEVVNQGQVVVDIGIAPNRPGEFIRFRFSQKTLTA